MKKPIPTLPLFNSEQRIRRILIFLIAVILLTAFFAFGRWKGELNMGDSLGYYLHLPSTFIYHDVGDYKKTVTAASKEIPYIPNPTYRWTITEPSPNGGRQIRWPVGVAVLTTPFFILAHSFCISTGLYPADGFSKPYFLLASLAPLCYVLLGLWLLFGLLIRFFTLRATVLTLGTLALATNLFYFSAYHNYMAHGFLFMLIAWLLWCTVRFWDQPSARMIILIGIATGLVALTRLQDVVVVFIPLLWGVQSWRTGRDRILFLVRHWHWLLLAIVAGLFCLVPQAFYYKAVSGQWWWYSYGNEQLDLLHPHILGGLFDYKNGWLIYTPVMIFALIGIFWLPRFVRPALSPLLLVLSLHMYISYSWWCWFYTNGYGSRPMVDLYPFLALPLATFFQLTWKNRIVKLMLSVLLIFFCWLNIFQVWQFQAGLIWSECETRAHYWAMFGKTKSSPAALIAYDSNEDQPTEPPIFVRILGQNGMEDSTNLHLVPEPHHSGRHAAFVGDQEYPAEVISPKDSLQDAREGDWIRASVWAYVPGTTKEYNQFSMAALAVDVQTADQRSLHSRAIRIATKIGNPEGSIWNAGATDQWGEAVFFVRIPKGFPKDGRVKAYIWNPNHEKLYVDDLKLEFWKQR